MAFESWADNLVLGDTNGYQDIFVHDRQTGVTERVSVDSFGMQGNHTSTNPCISTDGRFVVFESSADNLVAGDTNNSLDIFVHDRQARATERNSVDSLGVQGNYDSLNPSISEDGRYLAFDSHSDNLVPGDTNWRRDIFVHDRQTRVTERVSIDSLGAEGNQHSYFPSISADGSHVAFETLSDNLVSGDTNGYWDVFVHDRQTGVTELVSKDSLGVQGNSASHNPSISGDGRLVAFDSLSSNLVPGDTNDVFDIFVHDRQTGVTELASQDSLGVQGNNRCFMPSISADGRFVAFESSASNLWPGDLDLRKDVFVHDRQSGITEQVSVNSLGRGAIDSSVETSISSDGRYVAFISDADNLVLGDSNLGADVFVRDRWNGQGANSIYLTGPSTSPVLAPVYFSWQTTRGNSRYWLALSNNRSGSVLGGHYFDLGPPISVLATGTHPANGIGSFTSPLVPSGSAGFTILFEIAAQDAAGFLYDSNVHAVTFY